MLSTSAESGHTKSPDPTSFTGGNGYIVFDNGLIMQWGATKIPVYVSPTFSSTTYISFPIPFPNKVFSCLVALEDKYTESRSLNMGDTNTVLNTGNITKNGFHAIADYTSGAAALSFVEVHWLSIGY